MPDGSLEMFPGGAGMARFPILAQARFDVVPGLAAVMVGGRHGRTVAVGGQIVLVAAAAAAVVGVVMLAERRIVVRTQHGAVLRAARAGTPGRPGNASRAATQLLHLHFGAAHGVGNLLLVLADLFADHHFFHHPGRFFHHRFLGRLAQLDGFVFEAGHFRGADGLVDGAALDADVFFAQGDRLVDGGFHHPLENAHAAPLHLALAHPQFLFDHGQHRACGGLPGMPACVPPCALPWPPMLPCTLPAALCCDMPAASPAPIAPAAAAAPPASWPPGTACPPDSSSMSTGPCRSTMSAARSTSCSLMVTRVNTCWPRATKSA